MGLDAAPSEPTKLCRWPLRERMRKTARRRQRGRRGWLPYESVAAEFGQRGPASWRCEPWARRRRSRRDRQGGGGHHPGSAADPEVRRLGEEIQLEEIPLGLHLRPRHEALQNRHDRAVRDGDPAVLQRVCPANMAGGGASVSWTRGTSHWIRTGVSTERGSRSRGSVAPRTMTERVSLRAQPVSVSPRAAWHRCPARNGRSAVRRRPARPRRIHAGCVPSAGEAP